MWNDYLNRLVGVPEDVQNKLAMQFLRELASSRETGLSEEMRIKVMDQYARLVEVELIDVPTVKDKTTNADTGVYEQPLKKGQVVHVNLIGTGYVLNAPHYAIVWDCHPKAGTVGIIPLTSKKGTTPHKAEIGLIEGIEMKRGVQVDSIVLIGQFTTVSRKAIQIQSKVTAVGSVPVTLSQDQMTKVKDMFRVRYMAIPTLYEVLDKKIDMKLPLSIEKTMLDDLYRPVEYVVIKDQLFVKCSDYSEMKVIEIRDIGRLKFPERRSFIQALLSMDDTVRIGAETAVNGKLQMLLQAAPQKL